MPPVHHAPRAPVAPPSGAPSPSSPGSVAPAPVAASLLLVALAPFAIGYLFSYLYRGANAVVAGDLVAELGLSAGELGLLTAAYLGAFAAFQVPLGILLDRYGPRRVQGTLVLVGATGAFLFSIGRDAATLTLGRALIGIAFSGGLMSCFKAVVIWVAEPRRALANACLMSMGGLGLLLSTTPLEYAARTLGWRGAFLALAITTFAVGLLILFVVPERGTAISTERLATQIRQMGRIYGDRVFLAIVPLLGTTAGTHIGLQTLWAGPWFRDVVGLDRAGAANALFVMAIAFIASILLSGVIADRLVRRGFSLLSVVLGFLAIYFVAQVGLLLNPTDPIVSLVLWCVFGATGHVAVIAYPWFGRYFGSALSGRSSTAINLLLFGWAFVAQYGVGAILDRFPTSGGKYAPEAYQWAIGIFLAVQLLTLAWYVLNRQRIARAETISLQS
jgi:sugar phosphate permease